MTKFEYLCARVAEQCVTKERYGRDFIGYAANVRMDTYMAPVYRRARRAVVASFDPKTLEMHDVEV